MNYQQQILPVLGLENVKDIIVGGFHSISITSKGIWVWGKADMCNLGFPSDSTALQFPKFIQIDISQACAGNQHSFVWKNNQVYCWGSNKDYKLGFQNSLQYKLTKSLIFEEAIGAGMQLYEISCGDSHSLAFFKLFEQTGISYQIFAWGESKSYQLALETEGAVTEPILIDFNQSVRNVYSRSDYNFLITQQGDCYSWGTNLFGRLGFQKSINNQKIPTQVKFLTKIKTISMGKYHCIAINENYEAFCWGHGVQGQLGLNKIVSETIPTKIQFQQKIIQSACGQYHSVILTEKLQLYSCGSNSYFALGHQEVDEKKRCKKFVKIKIQENLKISKIASGNRHNLLLTIDGKVYSWGCNKFGQLGRMQLQVKATNIKKELYKQQNQIKMIKKEPDHLNKQKANPFTQIRQVYSPESEKQQKNLEWKICQWRQKYEKFKNQRDKQEKQLLNQLQQILKQGK